MRRGRVALVVAEIAAILTVVPLLIVASLTDWRYAFALAGCCSAVVLAWALVRRDRMLLQIWLFALVFGVAELAVDRWLVHGTGTLDYAPYASRGGPMWWASPAFMPFAWQVLAVHLAVLTEAVSHWRFTRRVGFALVIGAAYVPVGEELSVRAGFWVYKGVPMLSHVPAYIVVGETLLAISTVFLIPVLMRQRWWLTVPAGGAACLALWSGYFAGIRLL